jgi:hypothetical protein
MKKNGYGQYLTDLLRKNNDIYPIGHTGIIPASVPKGWRLPAPGNRRGVCMKLLVLGAGGIVAISNTGQKADLQCVGQIIFLAETGDNTGALAGAAQNHGEGNVLMKNL